MEIEMIKDEFKEIVPAVGKPCDKDLYDYRLGKPSKVWVYKSKEGLPRIYVRRFDVEGKKEFRPLIYGELDNICGWYAKNLSKNRPLLNLDKISKDKIKKILIVEGEKAATAAEKLFPDYIVTTSLNGSASASKTDWTPLKLREVVVFPDNDDAGKKYADSVIGFLREVNSSKIRLVELRKEFPRSWDLADKRPKDVGEAELRNMVVESKEVSRCPGVEVWNYNDFIAEGSVPEPEPILPGLLYKQEFTLLSATAKTGKSLLTLNLGLSVGSGSVFLGKYKAKQSKVLIVQFEVSNSALKKRIEKMNKHILVNKEQGDEIYICSSRFRIDESEGFEEFEGLIERYKPDLLIVDPFYCLHTKEENSSTSMSPILASLRELALRYNMAIMLVHHQGKKSEGGGSQVSHKARGSSSFGDVPDALWSMERGDGEAKLSFEMRNRAAPELLTMKISEDLVWEVTGEGQTDLKLLFYNLLGESNSLEKDKLSKDFMDKTGETKRSFNRKLLAAKGRNIVIEKKIAGTAVIYKNILK
jgi:5S rRNA maturation endonuclease (ribonuclease M5)